MSSSVTGRIYTWCPLCGYNVRKNREPSKPHQKICSNHSFLPFVCCRICSQEYQIDPTIVTTSRFCSVIFSNHDINGRTGSDYIPTSSDNVSLPKENDNFPDGWDIAVAIEEQEKKLHIDSISGKRYSLLKTSMNDKGSLLDQAKHIPLPKRLGISRMETLAMDPIELELMLFLNENFLPLSLFDDIMNWAFMARDVGNFQKRDCAPSHQTLKKHMNTHIISSIA